MTQPLAQALQIGQSFQLAQLDSSTIDLDPPQVDHIPVTSGVAGTAQSLSVRAVDAQGIASVTLLYRFNPGDEFKRILMREVLGTDNYTVALESSADQRLIEYYFLVIDTGGNKVLNGFPYEPFSRILTEPKAPLEQVKNTETTQSQKPPANQTAATEAIPQSAEPSTRNQNTLLWVALGVLVLGVLAGASGGGSDGATAQSGETVPVILNIPLPE